MQPRQDARPSSQLAQTHYESIFLLKAFLPVLLLVLLLVLGLRPVRLLTGLVGVLLEALSAVTHHVLLRRLCMRHGQLRCARCQLFRVVLLKAIPAVS
eukprot:2119160-Pyramimonas_sp.AAC.2